MNVHHPFCFYNSTPSVGLRGLNYTTQLCFLCMNNIVKLPHSIVLYWKIYSGAEIGSPTRDILFKLVLTQAAQLSPLTKGRRIKQYATEILRYYEQTKMALNFISFLCIILKHMYSNIIKKWCNKYKSNNPWT